MIRNLETLRAFAAWIVVIHHMRGALGEIWAPLGETLIFAIGVDVFFVLSGVVMVVSTDRNGDAPGAFLLRRLIRIAPLYWAATAAMAAALFAGLHPVGVTGWSAEDAIKAFLFWPDIRSDGYPGPLIPVGWTLTYEAGFYAIFAAALLAGRAAPLVAISAIICATALGGVFAGPETPYPLRVWSSPLMIEFAFGVALGLWWRAGGSCLRGAWRPALAIAAGGGALGAVCLAALAPTGDLITPGAMGATLRPLCFGVPAAALVFAAMAAEKAGHGPSTPCLAALGASSYAVYLLHMPIIHAVEATGLGPVVMLFLAPPLIAVSGHLAFTLFEAPVCAALRRFAFGQQRPKSSSRRMMSSSSR